MNRSNKMTSEFVELLCLFVWRLSLGIAFAAIAALFWQWLGASEEYRAFRRQFSRQPWAKKLLRLGPWLAERTHWTLAVAWREALRCGVWTPDDIDAAAIALSAAPGGAALTFLPGETFNPECMESENEHLPWVLTTTRPGLMWRGAVLVKAHVQTAQEDAIILATNSTHHLTARLVKLLGEPAGPLSRISRGALNGTLDTVARSEERDSWLRELHASAPTGTLSLIEPMDGEPFDDGTMESTEPLNSRQHAVVVNRLSVGLRRPGANGEVLVHAIVAARIKPREERI